MENIFEQAFKKLGYENKPIIKKSNTEYDFQCDDCFKLAKQYHKSPQTIGEEVVDEINKIDNYDDYFAEVIFAKPGFINIKVSDKYICDKLNKLMKKEILGAKKEDQTIVLDYGGPNVAKPLHVGHLRTAIIGQAINNILKFKGNKTISDVHLGDSGAQMGQVIYGILHDFPNQSAKDIEIDLNYLNVTYPKISGLCKEDEEVKEECRKINRDLQSGNKEYSILLDKILNVSVEDVKKIYKYLSVDFDYWYGERDAYKYIPQMLEKMEGVLEEDDGALVVKVAKEEDKIEIPPCIVKKSDGAYMYSTTDLATIYQRAEDFNPDQIIYVVDKRQSLHFTQVFRAAIKGKIYDKTLLHIGYGTVNGKDNKPFKTRSGTSFKLVDLINAVKEEFINLREENKMMSLEDQDKIVNAIIKFADLQNNLERDYIFDIKGFSEVNGKTGPYILYTYLRIDKIKQDKIGDLSNQIYSETDRQLRLKLLEVSDVINISSSERRPHYIADYLYDLAVISNNFYQNNKVSITSGNQRQDFDILLTFNNKVIKTLLNLLGIDIPKSM